MLRKNKLLYTGLFFTALVLILLFSRNYNAVFVDELIYCRWIYKMVFENLGYLQPLQWGKHPLFFWINGFLATLLKNLPHHNMSILNVLKITAIFNLLITAFGLSLYFRKKILKLVIPIIFMLGPFFLIYFSIGMIENMIISLTVLYWYSLSRLADFINHKNKFWLYYGLTILLGLMVALTKSNTASVIFSSMIICFFYIFKDEKKNIWKWLGLFCVNTFLIGINLYIAFHFAPTESNNVISFKHNFSVFFTNITHYVSYIPYFFSFSFLFISVLTIIYMMRKKNLLALIKIPINQILIVNLLISTMMVLFLTVYYPRYYLICFLALFLCVAKVYEKLNSHFSHKKILIWIFSLLLLFDLVFVSFPSLIYRWRIPPIDITQHFDRSSVHIPYDFKKNVIDKNPKAVFLINDDRYGANNLFYGLIPVSIKHPNFQIRVYEDIDKLNSDLLCNQYPHYLIYVWGDSSITKNKQIMKNMLFKSYYSFNQKESLNIYKINCK